MALVVFVGKTLNIAVMVVSQTWIMSYSQRIGLTAYRLKGTSGTSGPTSEKDKMLLGLPFQGRDKELWQDRVRARKLLRKYNQELAYDNVMGKREVLQQLLGSLDLAEPPFLEPPFFCDYGEARVAEAHNQQVCLAL